MKKVIALASLLLILAPVSILTATEDHGEGHICFRRIDANQDDFVVPAEFIKYFPKQPGLFEKIDHDNDGQITHDEYEDYWFSQEE